MVTWNRREYFERTIQNLLKDPSAFRLYIWDNGSEDGVADLVNELSDERVVSKRLNTANVGQAEPWRWFLDTAVGTVGGKLDDDIVAPAGWMSRFNEMIIAEPRFGTLGAWVYLKSDWNAELAKHKVRKIGAHELFLNPWVPGGIFLARLAYLQKHTPRHTNAWGIPLDQGAMFRSGLINGYPLPLVFAEHLDDPRSPHCRMTKPGGWDQFAAYSARMRGFSGPEEYGRWIASDAEQVLKTPLKRQLSEMQRRQRTQLIRRGAARVRRLFSSRSA